MFFNPLRDISRRRKTSYMYFFCEFKIFVSPCSELNLFFYDSDDIFPHRVFIWCLIRVTRELRFSLPCGKVVRDRDRLYDRSAVSLLPVIFIDVEFLAADLWAGNFETEKITRTASASARIGVNFSLNGEKEAVRNETRLMRKDFGTVRYGTVSRQHRKRSRRRRRLRWQRRLAVVNPRWPRREENTNAGICEITTDRVR